MITVVLKSSDDFLDNLKTILTATKAKQENTVTILVSRLWYMDIYDLMASQKAIGVLKIGAETFFMVKEMRIEIKPIDLYI